MECRHRPGFQASGACAVKGVCVGNVGGGFACLGNGRVPEVEPGTRLDFDDPAVQGAVAREEEEHDDAGPPLRWEPLSGGGEVHELTAAEQEMVGRCGHTCRHGFRGVHTCGRKAGHSGMHGDTDNGPSFWANDAWPVSGPTPISASASNPCDDCYRQGIRQGATEVGEWLVEDTVEILEEMGARVGRLILEGHRNGKSLTKGEETVAGFEVLRDLTRERWCMPALLPKPSGEVALDHTAQVLREILAQVDLLDAAETAHVALLEWNTDIGGGPNKAERAARIMRDRIAALLKASIGS